MPEGFEEPLRVYIFEAVDRYGAGPPAQVESFGDSEQMAREVLRDCGFEALELLEVEEQELHIEGSWLGESE